MAENLKNLAEPLITRAVDRTLVRSSDVPAGVTLRRLFTKRDHGSLMNVGIYEIDPGDASKWWSTESIPCEEPGMFNVGPVHEFLYVLSGICTLETPTGSTDCVEGVAAFIPPEGRFRMVNKSDALTRVIYGLTPTIY